MRNRINFLGSDNNGRSYTDNCQETINFYPEPKPSIEESKSPVILIGTPGFDELFRIASTASGVRAAHVTDLDMLYVVVGTTLYEVSRDGAYASVGTLLTSDGPVSIAENRYQMMLCDGSFGYIFTFATRAFSPITSEGYSSGSSVVCSNGYFVQNINASSKFIFSEYQDGTKWSADWFYDAESSSDHILAIGIVSGELWMFGSRTTERWYFKGPSADDPYDVFARFGNAVLNVGIDPVRSLAQIGDTMFFLGSNQQGANTVFMTSGSTVQKISNHGIEYRIGQIDDTSDAVGYCYQQEGHTFYVLTFTTGDLTIVYDVSTGLWHRRAERGRGLKHQRFSRCVYWNKKVVVAEEKNPIFHEMGLDIYDDNGEMVVRRRTGSVIHSSRNRIFFKQFEVDLDRGEAIGVVEKIDGALTYGKPVAYYGIGDVVLFAGKHYRSKVACNGHQPTIDQSDQYWDFLTTSGVIPHLCLQWSDDHGKTWSNELWSETGRSGQYSERINFNRLGSSYSRSFRIEVSDPIRWVIVDAVADIEMEAA